MSHDLYTYGTIDPVYFILVDPTGQRYPSHIFVPTDVWLILDAAAAIDVSDECVHVAQGLYKWTPTSSARTNAEVIALLINDSAGSNFVDNALILATGGNVAARFSG